MKSLCSMVPYSGLLGSRGREQGCLLTCATQERPMEDIHFHSALWYWYWHWLTPHSLGYGQDWVATWGHSCILAVWMASLKFSVSGEILLKGDCAVLSCSLQPVSSTVTKPSREGWNAIWEALFSAGSLAHRVGWKSAWGWPHPAPCLQRHPRQLLSVFGFPFGSLNLTCRNHLQRTTVTVMFPSSLAWTLLHNPAAA